LGTCEAPDRASVLLVSVSLAALSKPKSSTFKSVARDEDVALRVPMMFGCASATQRHRLALEGATAPLLGH
jgi:hypothetical protein